MGVEVGMAANEERTRQEMKDLETWIDEAEKRMYVCASKEGINKENVILSDEFIELVQNIKSEYEVNGFMKRRVQEAMDTFQAVKPFTSARFGTLREKNNTFMNLIFTLEAQQKTKLDALREEEERKKEKENILSSQHIELDADGNPLKLSNSRRNELADGLSWLSGCDRDENGEDDSHKIWRVRL